MKPHQLRAFLAIAEGGSLAKASGKLHKTSAALSKSIRELEGHFNIELFDRTSRGMTLSAAGRVLLPRARAILAERTRADEELRLLKDEQGGLLRIGMTPAVAVLAAPELIERCLVQLPSVQLELHEFQRDLMMPRLDDGTLDIVLYALPSYMNQEPPLRDGLLYQTDLAVAVRAGGALASARSLAELRDALWIYSDPAGDQQAFVEQRFRSANLEPPPKFMLCTAAVLGLSVTLQMDAVALVARPVAEFYEGIALVPVLGRPPTLSVYSLVRHSVATSPLVEMFLSVVRDALKNQADRPIARDTRVSR